MAAAIRLAILYLVTSTVGIGWSIVLAFRDLRNKPHPEPLRPAPLWVNALFMAGVTLILVGLAWLQWTRLEFVLTGAVIMIFVGVVALNAGMWGLLYTAARKGGKKP